MIKNKKIPVGSYGIIKDRSDPEDLNYVIEEIRRQGRWRSDAFLQYIRLGRAQRLEQQLKLSEDLASVAEAELSERPRPSGR